MSYEMNEWKKGDVISATKLNHMEQGIANVILVVNCVWDESIENEALDKTWQEIADATYAVVKQQGVGGMLSYSPVATIGVAEGKYVVSIKDGVEDIGFSCSAPNEYPAYDDGGISPK